MKKIIQNLKTKAKNLKHEIAAIYYAYLNPETPLLPKIVILITIGYALSPIDLIPDFIPILGYIDDLLILPGLITLSIKLIPKDIMAQSIKKAKAEPPILRKNWFFAVLFISIWVLIAAAVVMKIKS